MLRGRAAFCVFSRQRTPDLVAAARPGKPQTVGPSQGCGRSHHANRLHARHRTAACDRALRRRSSLRCRSCIRAATNAHRMLVQAARRGLCQQASTRLGGPRHAPRGSRLQATSSRCRSQRHHLHAIAHIDCGRQRHRCPPLKALSAVRAKSGPRSRPTTVRHSGEAVDVARHDNDLTWHRGYRRRPTRRERIRHDLHLPAHAIDAPRQRHHRATVKAWCVVPRKPRHTSRHHGSRAIRDTRHTHGNPGDRIAPSLTGPHRSSRRHGPWIGRRGQTRNAASHRPQRRGGRCQTRRRRCIGPLVEDA